MAKAPRRSHRQAIILTAVLAPLLVATVIYSVRIWGELDDTSMSSAGYVALGIGVVAAMAVGAGLMGLVFYSSRHGYDEGAGEDQIVMPPPEDGSDPAPRA